MRVPRALIVEDDQPIQQLIRTVLTRAGIDSEVVPNGREALQALRSSSFDVISLDLMMPELDGWDFLDVARILAPSSRRRVIVVTGVSLATVEIVSADPDVFRVFRKPFDISEYCRAVVECIGEEPGRDAAMSRDALLDAQLAKDSSFLRAHGCVLLRREGEMLHAVARFNYGHDVLKQFIPLSVEAEVPLSIAVRSGKAVVIASLKSAATTYPDLVPVWERFGSFSLAALPLLADGEVVGAVGWTWGEPRDFDPSFRSRLDRIARKYAILVDFLSGESSADASVA